MVEIQWSNAYVRALRDAVFKELFREFMGALLFIRNLFYFEIVVLQNRLSNSLV